MYVQKKNPFKSSGTPLKQSEGDAPWGDIKPARGALSNLASNVKAKFKSKDAKAIAGIASFVVPWGRVAKAGGKLLKAFSNTPKQYAKMVKGKSKFPKMSAEKKKFFNPDGSSKTGDLYAAARARANKPATRPTGGFKELVTGNQTHTTKSINKAFEQRFGKPKAAKTVTDGWGNTAEGVARGINVGAKPLTPVQKALVNQKGIIKNSPIKQKNTDKLYEKAEKLQGKADKAASKGKYKKAARMENRVARVEKRENKKRNKYNY